MFKGLVSEMDFAKERPDETAPEKAIRTYGLGVFRLWRGEKDRARDLFKELAWGDSWASFATIAAEVELADLVRLDPDRAAVGTA